MSQRQEPVADHWNRETLTWQIARANGFQPGALQANRAGYLVTTQKLRFVAPFAGAVVVGLGFAALLIFLFAQEADRREGAWWLVPLVLVIIALSLLFLRRQLVTLSDHLQGKVVSTIGMVTKGEVLSSGREADAVTPTSDVSYYYKVKGQRFQVKEAGYDALIEGLEYRLYFLPRSQVLVNIEALNE